jgi:hypothetical protein
MKHLLLLSFVIVISHSIQAQNYNCKIFHSNGSHYFLNIKSINELGLTDSANNYISYKKIDSLITNSASFLEKVKIIQNVKYYLNKNNEYVIFFDKSFFKSKDEVTFIELHSMISLNSISYNFLSVHFQYKFSFLSALYQKVLISGGNTFTNPNYYSLNFGYGIGVRLPIKEFDIQFWLNCTSSTLYTTSSEGLYSLEDKTQFFISVLNYFNLDNIGNVQLGIGLNLYLNQFDVENRKQQLSIQAGVNIAI